MGDLGFFNEAAPDWKSQPEPATPTVPVKQDPSTWVSAPVAAPAAPVSPADQRQQALTSALANTWNGQAPMTTQDAQIAGNTPFVDPLKNSNGQLFAVGGVTQAKSTGGTYLTPEAKKAAARAEAESGKAAASKVAEGELIARDAEELSNQKIDNAAKLQAKAAEDLAKLDAIKKRVDDTMLQQQKDTDEYLKAQKGLDPNRMMKGGRGVLAAIASGLGAYGAILGHSENFAMKIIENAIQRDYQAQKDVVDSKKYRSEATGRLVQSLRQSLSDEQSVQLGHNAAVKTAMAEQLEGMATKMKGTEAAANMLTTASQLKAAAAQTRAELLGREQIHASTSTQTQIVPFSKTSAINSVLAETAQNEKYRKEIADARGETPVGTNIDAQEKAIGAVTADVGILRNLTEFRKLLKGDIASGLNVGLSQRAAEMQQSLLLALEDYGRQQSGGAITKEEIDNFEKEVKGGNLTVTSDAIDKLVKRYQNHLANKSATSINSLHKQLVIPSWGRIRSAIGDDNLFRQVYNRKFDDAEGMAQQYGGIVRGGASREDQLKERLMQQYQGSPSK